MVTQSKSDDPKKDGYIDRQKKNLAKGKVCFICNLIHEFAMWPGTYVLLPILIAIASLHLIDDKQVASTLLMWALACLSFGACIGFLFAIPKRQESQHTKANNDNSLLTPNTNLQEVSDWLTKMLVGIGLIQFNDISKYIYTISEKIGLSAQGVEKYDYSMYAMALIIVFTTCGFMLGYLGTRLKLSPELTKADNATLGKIQQLDIRIDEIDTRVRKHEDIGDMISVAEKYITMADIYKDIIKEYGDKEIIREKRKRLLEKARIIFEDIMDSDEHNIPASIGLALYYDRLEKPNYGEALKVLKNAIDNIQHKNERKIALPRLYYNKACYEFLDKEKFDSAKPDLEKAINMNKKYKKFAEFDSDWNKARNIDDFKELTKL